MPPKYVCVVSIVRGGVIYAGECYSAAAQALEPGTCFGRGATPVEAQSEALKWASKFRG